MVGGGERSKRTVLPNFKFARVRERETRRDREDLDRCWDVGMVGCLVST